MLSVTCSARVKPMLKIKAAMAAIPMMVFVVIVVRLILMNKYFKERNFRCKDRDFLGKVKRLGKNLDTFSGKIRTFADRFPN